LLFIIFIFILVLYQLPILDLTSDM